ncbi:hypothetical protein L596_026413 [Steinernema carpocapsae]|uniref:Uncharacterized protein n=1 Tax=Steinernema carpocapsae TaxID=34508 RepID=A0A4U5M1A6_STECR|nr:hypothetical protein L596_026413 [Steinernema carpocapsae]
MSLFGQTRVTVAAPFAFSRVLPSPRTGRFCDRVGAGAANAELGPVTGRSVVHAFSKNAVFFVKLSQTKDAKLSNS